MNYNFINNFNIGIFNKERIIKTKSVIFNHTKFYYLVKINLFYFLTQLIKLIVKILKFLKMSTSFNDLMKKNKINKIEFVINNFDQLTNISSISEKISEKISKN